MRAIILAGGKGARLRPYTVVIPKPLMPIGEYPILEVILKQLVYYGFNRITMTVHHQSELMQAFFGKGEKWGIKIDYSLEDRPLSTMGPLRLIRDLPDNFLVMNGDILTDLDFREIFDHHVENNVLFTISSCKRELRSEYGVLELNRKNQLIGFKEKPVIEYDVSMGVYVVNKSILKYIPEGIPYGFDQLMVDLIKSGHPAHVRRFSGYWLDIGRQDDYMQAIEDFEKLKHLFIK